MSFRQSLPARLESISIMRTSRLFESPQTIRDALRAFHSTVIVAAHLRASLVNAADVIGRTAWSRDFLERVAAFRNGEVVLGAASLFDVIDLQAVELHPMNLVARF